MTINAFPASFDPNHQFQNGMSLRDWFAGQALAGYAGSSHVALAGRPQLVARFAYLFADAMLQARKRPIFQFHDPAMLDELRQKYRDQNAWMNETPARRDDGSSAGGDQ